MYTCIRVCMYACMYVRAYMYISIRSEFIFMNVGRVIRSEGMNGSFTNSFPKGFYITGFSEGRLYHI